MTVGLIPPSTSAGKSAQQCIFFPLVFLCHMPARAHVLLHRDGFRLLIDGGYYGLNSQGLTTLPMVHHGNLSS